MFGMFNPLDTYRQDDLSIYVKLSSRLVPALSILCLYVRFFFQFGSLVAP